MDGSLSRSSQSVKDMCKNILKYINVPICLWDERLSTVGAFNLSSQLDVNISKKVKNIDKNSKEPIKANKNPSLDKPNVPAHSAII